MNFAALQNVHFKNVCLVIFLVVLLNHINDDRQIINYNMQRFDDI